MAYREVRSDAIDIKKHAGVHYEGVYMGRKEITTEIGKQFVYKFRTAKGRVFSVYGFTMLNLAMESLLPDSVCRITYLGTENVKTKFGMKDVHQVLVEVDDGDEDGEFNPAEEFEDGNIDDPGNPV